MKPERWEQIERLYYSALEREAGERESFLDRACAGDDELRREISSLLAHAGIATSLLLTAPISRESLLQVIRLDSKFLSEEHGFTAFIRINQEAPKSGEDVLTHNHFGFVGGALPHSVQLLMAYPWKSQRLPIRIAPAELDRKSSAFRVYVPPSVSHFR